MPNNTKSYIKYYEIVFDSSARGGPGLLSTIFLHKKTPPFGGVNCLRLWRLHHALNKAILRIGLAHKASLKLFRHSQIPLRL